MMIYQLAEKFKEPDSGVIARLPANTLLHWIAYYKLQRSENSTSKTYQYDGDVDKQCAEVMRILQ